MHDRLIIWGFFAILGLSAGTMAALHPNIRKPKPPPRIEPIPITVVAESLKADKLEPDTIVPFSVRTIPYAPLFQPPVSNPKFEPTPQPIISAQTEFPKLPQPKITKSKSDDKSDVCARHGMHKETYDNGRRWRCKR